MGIAVNQIYPSLQNKEELLVALPLPLLLVEEEADGDYQALGNLGRRDPRVVPNCLILSEIRFSSMLHTMQHAA